MLSLDDHFNSLTPLHQQRLMELIIRTINGDYKHNSLPIMNVFNPMVSLPSKKMKKLFSKTKNNGYYKKVIEPYFVCVDNGYSFGMWSKNMTKKYCLRDWVYDEMFRYWEDTKPIQIQMIKNGEFYDCNKEDVPSNGISLKDNLGNNKSTKLKINPMVKMNVDYLSKVIDELKYSTSIKPRKGIKRNNLIQLYRWKSVLNNNLSQDSIIQLYTESGNGRLNPKNQLNIPHLISTPNRIRKVLFKDMDYWDYDMSNSHLSIFQGLCQNYDMDCPYIREYNSNKSHYRNLWSDKWYKDIKYIKPYVISWLYGNNNNSVPSNPFYKTLGLWRMKEIKKDRMLSGIYDEIQIGRKIIIEKHKTKSGLLRNIMGKETQPKSTNGKSLCFILFGIETKVLEIVNELIGDKMKVLIYDGWIGEEIDIDQVENKVKSTLNMDIKFHKDSMKQDTFILK